MSANNIYNENILANSSTSTSVLIVDTQNPPDGSGGGGGGSDSDAPGYDPEPPSDNDPSWQEVIPNYELSQEQLNLQDENRSLKQNNVPLMGFTLLAYFILT